MELARLGRGREPGVDLVTVRLSGSRPLLALLWSMGLVAAVFRAAVDAASPLAADVDAGSEARLRLGRDMLPILPRPG